MQPLARPSTDPGRTPQDDAATSTSTPLLPNGTDGCEITGATYRVGALDSGREPPRRQRDRRRAASSPFLPGASLPTTHQSGVQSRPQLPRSAPAELARRHRAIHVQAASTRPLDAIHGTHQGLSCRSSEPDQCGDEYKAGAVERGAFGVAGGQVSPLLEPVEAVFDHVNAPHLVALVRAGATFTKGKLIERTTQAEADTAARAA
jgi:hypothetical protein